MIAAKILEDARVADNFRPRVVTIIGQPLVAQMIAPHLLEREVMPTFQQQHSLSGFRQHARRDPAACARANDNGIVMHRCLRHPRTSKPIIFHETAFLLPPLPGSL